MYQQQAPPSLPPSYNAIPPSSQMGHHQQPAHTAVYIGNTQGFTGFDNKAIRAAFVSKVYAILALQLAFATAVIALITLHQPTKVYFQQNGQLYLIISGVVALGVLLVLACVETARRTFPMNFILLTVLTVAYALVAGTASALYDTQTVLCAFGATAFAFVALMLVAKYAPFDMTECGCALCILALIHLVASIILNIILVPMGYASTSALIIAGIGAFLVSLYIVYDLQLIMGGGRNQLSPEEYVLAAAILYCDIINLFNYMLILFGSSSRG